MNFSLHRFAWGGHIRTGFHIAVLSWSGNHSGAPLGRGSYRRYDALSHHGLQFFLDLGKYWVRYTPWSVLVSKQVLRCSSRGSCISDLIGLGVFGPEVGVVSRLRTWEAGTSNFSACIVDLLRRLLAWLDMTYSRTPQDGHPDETDTYIKWTPNLGPCRFFSHLLYFKSL